MGKPASYTGMHVYKSLHYLHKKIDRWWIRLLVPGLQEVLQVHHENLDDLRKDLNRDYPTIQQCKEFGIPPVTVASGPGGDKIIGGQ